MPKLGLTMEEATIIEWLVPDGEVVAPDVPIVLIETDKTETEVVSPGAGQLHQIARPGDVIPCGAPIGLLLADGESPPAAPTDDRAPMATATAPTATATTATATTATATTTAVRAESGRVLASPNARRVAAARGIALASVRGTGPGGRIVSEDVEAAAALPATQQTGGGVTLATAAARQLAELLGVDLAAIPVDPVERRITREGVALHVRRLLQRLAPAPVEPAPVAPSVRPALLQEPIQVIPLSGMRGTIARRMHASLREMAQLTLTMDADMGAVLSDRAGRADRARDGQADGAAPSLTDYVVAAVARALVRHQIVNAQVTDAGIAVLPEVHVGLAVAVEGGLLVPVIRDAADRDLDALATETRRLVDGARRGTLGPSELEGGTFSVSTLGMYGVDVFTPVINPPNAAVLGVGRLRDELVLQPGGDGSLTTRKVLTLSLTWDHRVLDGAPAAEFCRTIVELLAEPERLDAA